MTENTDKPYVLLKGAMIDPVDTERLEAMREHLHDYSVLVQPEDEVVEQIIDRVEIVFGSLPAHLWEKARALRWIQLQSAGIDPVPRDIDTSSITVTTASGVHADPISEHLLAMILFFARDFGRAVDDQRSHYWRSERDHDLFELSGRRVLLLGTGAIGDAFAYKARALGMEIVGMKRNPHRPPQIVSGEDEAAPHGMPGLHGHGMPDTTGGGGIYKRIVGHDSLAEELPASDMAVITLPETAETRHMLGPHELSLLPSHALVFNIGRGGVIDQNALVEALHSGTIAGAGLDVFDPEPLENDSPLWDMENVLVTTHYSGMTPMYSQRLWSIFLDNCARYTAGRAMRNAAGVRRGY